MFSRIRGSIHKSAAKENLECKCVNVPINDTNDEQGKIINVECSTGFCVVDDSGLCAREENSAHCSLSPVELIGELAAADAMLPQKKCSDICGKRFHSYKIDLNNAIDTGLLTDKQCQTCGTHCSAATCSGRTREFLISWDKTRARILVFIVLALGLWLCVYISVTATAT